MPDQDDTNPTEQPQSDSAKGDAPGASDALAALAAAKAAVDAVRSGVPLPTPFQEPEGEPVGEAAAGASPAGTAFALPSFDAPSAKPASAGLDLLSDVNLNVKIELGRTRMLVEDVLRLSEGAVVELDKLAGDPVDVFVNDRPIARGEILVVNDNFCIRINEIIGAPEEAAKT